MDHYMEMFKTWGILYGQKIVIAVLIFVIGKWAAKFISSATAKILRKGSVDETLTIFLKDIAYYVLLVVVVIAALNQLGFETTSLVAVLATAGLAIGLALKDSLSNFASGVMLILFRPFKVGDFVEAGGTSGVVEIISIFNTKFKTGDNKQVIVPNASILGGNITNYSAKETRRIDLVFGVSYNDDIKKVKEVLQDIVDSDSRILKDPAVKIAVSELADSSVNFVVRPWVNSADYWDVYFDMQEKVKMRFDAAGISIPFPQMDVHHDK